MKFEINLGELCTSTPDRREILVFEFTYMLGTEMRGRAIDAGLL
jgi:hypothetical protein